MIFSLIPVDSFWLIRPLFQLLLSALFFTLSVIIKKNRVTGYIFIVLFNCGSWLLIGEFAKVNYIYSITIGVLTSITLLFLLKFRFSKLIFISGTILLLILSNNNYQQENFKSIETYGYSRNFNFDSSLVYSEKIGLSRIYNSLQWGFTSELPLRGRYTLPENEEASPIVFVLHGNHLAEEESHKGYDYILKELSERGFVAVSLDQNYLNGDWTNLGVGYPKENDVRAHVLLSTIDLFRKMNNEVESSLYNRIDFNHISVIGHSRGGEAGAIAASIDKRIKCLIALAPTFGQYSSSIKLDNIDYLLLQGSNDGDLRYFRGFNQFKRTLKSNKISLIIEGFNHSGFNSDWGSSDGTGPGNIYYKKNLNILPSIQQSITKDLITNFLTYSHNGRELDITGILDNFNLKYTLNEVFKGDIKIKSSTKLRENSSILINRDDDRNMKLSIFNPSNKMVNLKITDDLGNTQILEIKPKIEWKLLRFKFLEKRVDRDRNPHSYYLDLNSNWRTLNIYNPSKTELYIDAISTSHQRIE